MNEPIPLREFVLAAIVDLLADSVESLVLRELAEHTRGKGLGGGVWIRSVTDATCSPHASDRPLGLLSRALRLTIVEQMTLALLVSVDEDPLLGRAIAELQHPIAGSRPSLGLVAAALGPLVPGAQPLHVLLTGAAIASGAILASSSDRPLAERVLSLPMAISLALRDQDSSWPGAAIGLGTFPEVRLAGSVVAEAERQGRTLMHGERSLVIRTGSVAEGRAVATAVAGAVGRRAVFLEGDVTAGLGPWLLLRGLAPVFCFELGPGERKRTPGLPYYDGPILVVTGPDGSIDTGGAGAPDWSLGVPPPPERTALWTAAIGAGELASELARCHRHGAGRIAHLGRLARHRMLLEGAERVSREHVQAASWVDEGLGMTGLAQPLTAPVHDDALVTAVPLRAELEHLLLRCRTRDGLDEGLGASLRARYRPGVRALFIGPSGTGKTLAAGWLATRLAIPLYRVDLAAVTSKYIGETEKNLAQLLARAEHADVVLLFDEADSMFGKRTDIKEANDRFANAQTNYLLQRLESYDGIAILTSNSRARFDNAFVRRLDAILEFPLPGPEVRRDLWLSHLGAMHSLSPRSINKLAATAELTGGHIRNVVLTAAVRARSTGRSIEYSDILTGLVAELRKLGRQMPQELRKED